jgi:hypothetical protein
MQVLMRAVTLRKGNTLLLHTFVATVLLGLVAPEEVIVLDHTHTEITRDNITTIHNTNTTLADTTDTDASPDAVVESIMHSDDLMYASVDTHTRTGTHAVTGDVISISAVHMMVMDLSLTTITLESSGGSTVRTPGHVEVRHEDATESLAMAWAAAIEESGHTTYPIEYTHDGVNHKEYTRSLVTRAHRVRQTVDMSTEEYITTLDYLILR